MQPEIAPPPPACVSADVIQSGWQALIDRHVSPGSIEVIHGEAAQDFSDLAAIMRGVSLFETSGVIVFKSSEGGAAADFIGPDGCSAVVVTFEPGQYEGLRRLMVSSWHRAKT